MTSPSERPPTDVSPIGRRRAVPKDELLVIFEAASAEDDDLRADLDQALSADLRDPYEGTGR